MMATDRPASSCCCWPARSWPSPAPCPMWVPGTLPACLHPRPDPDQGRHRAHFGLRARPGRRQPADPRLHPPPTQPRP